MREILFQLENDIDATKFDQLRRGIVIEKALALLRTEIEGALPKERDTYGAAIDPFKAPNIGWNECLEQVRASMDRVWGVEE